MLTDLDEDDEMTNNFDTSDKEILDIYDIGELDSNDGYVQFMDTYGIKCGWYIGCEPGIKIDFDNGMSVKFTELLDSDGIRNNDKISAAIAELRRIVFGHDNEEDNYSTDMPDIF